MPTITFIASGKKLPVSVPAGETVLTAARLAGLPLDAPCSGGGACGKCRVKLLSGELDSPRTRHITDGEFRAGWRLACGSKVTSDAVIEVPDAASAYRGRMRTADSAPPADPDRLARAGIAFGCNLSAVTVSLDAPTPDDTLPDTERLARALQAAAGAQHVTFTYPALRALAQVLREHGFRARCIVEREGDRLTVLDVLPPADAAPLAGLAVDLGTTSVAAALMDLQTGRTLASGAVGNGQIRYGADVITRIIESCRDGGRQRLQAAVTDESLRPLIHRLCADAGVDPRRVYRACVAGNTAMNHLLLGLYADPVRLEPYIPTFLRCDDLRAASLGLGLHPEAKLMLAPNVGSYVGGDITAGTFASMLWDQEALTLLIDLGTNGELVLGNREFMMTCACSAGPAFEGGGLSCGMRATDGAIDAITVDPDTLEPRFTTIGDAPPAGICGSGIIDLVAALFRARAINGRGRFVREHPRVRFDEDGMGSYIIATRQDNGERDIAVTEADIDSFIRAKGAVFSAAMTMLAAVGLDPSALERVLVSGGIGSGIDMDNAVAVGMLPDIDRERFAYIGNTALAGARAMLTSDRAREKVHQIAAAMTYLELSTEPAYMDAFVAACFLPHTDAELFPSSKGIPS